MHCSYGPYVCWRGNGEQFFMDRVTVESLLENISRAFSNHPFDAEYVELALLQIELAKL